MKQGVKIESTTAYPQFKARSVEGKRSKSQKSRLTTDSSWPIPSQKI